MIKSMTGFGNAGFEDERMMIHVEVKSLNSKFLDLSIRSPRQFSDKEHEIRNLVLAVLDRGKVNVMIDFFPKSASQLPLNINEKLFKSVYAQFKTLALSVDDQSHDLFKLALQAPNVMSAISTEINKEDDEWIIVKKTLEEALQKCEGFRKDEGNSLEVKLEENINTIAKGLDLIQGADGGRKEKIKQKIKNHFSEWLDENSFDANRFEQELIYYFEKLDITEEIVRLDTHLKYFLKCMKEDSSQGKKLGFISQEIGREINTIGSKANDAFVQQYVILMKDELEKIKEQAMNVL